MSSSAFAALAPALQHHVIGTLGWRELRPMQERAIEPVLAGEHVVLSAPTAGGKTESALFPLLTRMTDEHWDGLSVLYVCPLRALLNDLEPRVQRLCSFVGRTAAIWHGDVASTRRSAILREPPDVLLTTPESLEAMSLSVRVDHRRMLGQVQAVVVDEVHAFAGDDRGWHLLAVLARLDALLGAPAQRVGLTATVGNPEELLDWLVNDGSSNRARRAVVVAPSEESAVPELEIDWVESVGNAAQIIAALHRGEKRLVFADSRARVEELATALRELGVQVFLSHSSLAPAERRDAEAAFREARDCVIVSTSTLELGIDVGDLDRVIQLGAPATTSSVLQRLGRAGRRPGTRRNCLFLATQDEELVQALALCDRVLAGWVEPLVAPALPVHLVAQQLLAGTLADGRLDRSQWPGPLARVFSSGGMDGQVVAEIVEHAVAGGLLAEEGGLLSIGPVGEEEYGFRHFIEVVSLFLSAPLLAVRHGRRDLGFVDPTALSRPPAGGPTVILLGGHAWAVVDVDWRQSLVWVTPSEDPGRIRWSGEGRALSFELCQAQRRVLAGAAGGAEALMTRRARARLEELRNEIGAVPEEGTWLVRDHDAGRTWWWTFAGARANAQLTAALEANGTAVRGFDDLRIGVDPGWSPSSEVRRALGHSTAPSVDAERLQAVKFADVVPDRLLERMLQTRGADSPAFAWAVEASVTRVS